MLMTEFIANICCIVYYVIATVGALPTIARIIKRKSSTDISKVSVCMDALSTTCWTIYIFLTHQTLLVYVGTVWDFIVVAVYITVVLKYHGKR